MSLILQLENVGIIGKARVQFDGLTVIAGVNDTGKSTIGKIMYSLVYSLNIYYADIEKATESAVLNSVEMLYEKLMQYQDSIDDELLRNFSIEKFNEDLNRRLSLDDKDKLNEFLTLKQNLLDYLDQLDKDAIAPYFDAIRNAATQKPDISIKLILERVFLSEFYAELSNKNNTQPATIQLLKNEDIVLSVTLLENEITEIAGEYDRLQYTIPQEIFFVESPIVLQLNHIIQSGAVLAEIMNNMSSKTDEVVLHIKHLMERLRLLRHPFHLSADEENVLTNISQTIGGEWQYDKTREDFVFVKKDEQKNDIRFRPSNTASGIKMLGVLQILLKIRKLNSNTLLIIDEPENHVHPEWQIKLVELLVTILQNRVQIIIPSHSTYVIQAIKHYAEKQKTESRISFYSSEIQQNSNSSVFADITNNLDTLYLKLAQPLYQLVWPE